MATVIMVLVEILARLVNRMLCSQLPIVLDHRMKHRHPQGRFLNFIIMFEIEVVEIFEVMLMKD